MDKSLSIGPSAFRGWARDTQVSGVRAVQPVVRRVEQERAAATDRAPETTYTPRTSATDTQPLYSRKGIPAASSNVFTASSWERTDTFDLQVQTAEGDIATLRFSQSSSGASSASEVQSATGRVQTASLQASQDASLAIDVQGNLNEQERASINALANQVQAVAGDFFDGDTAGAMQSAGRIDISAQGETLQAYAFSLQSTEIQMAAAIYEDVAKSTAGLNVQMPLDGPEPASALPPAPAENGTKGLLKELLAMFDRLSGTELAPATSGTRA